MSTRVIVTRPEREARQWVQALVQRGLAAEALPLIGIGAVGDQYALQRAWHGLADDHAVMFVSANAVEHFFAARPSGVAWGAVRAWATGPGTAEALSRAGVLPSSIDAPSATAPRFDSEALWALVAHAPLAGRRVLIVRGADDAGRVAGRPWLAERLASVGATVDQVVAYQRCLPVWRDDDRVRARRAAHDGAIWLFSSSDALRHLSLLLPDEGWQAARAVATHVRIAEAAADLGFGRVTVAHPSLAAVAASIESLQ